MLSENMAAGPDDAALLLLDAIVAARRDAGVAEILRAGFATYEKAIARATEAGTELGSRSALDPTDLVRVLALLSFGRLVSEAIGAPAPAPHAYDRLVDLLSALVRRHDRGRIAGRHRQGPVASGRLERARRRSPTAVAAVGAGHSLRRGGGRRGVPRTGSPDPARHGALIGSCFGPLS